MTFASSLLLSGIRRWGVGRLPISRAIFNAIGVFPIVDHYYEPLFIPKLLSRSLDEERELPAINLNVDAQLELLEQFDYNEEVAAFPLNGFGRHGFYYHNGAFESGDAEYLYSVIRHFKPRRIVEIGGGFSTCLAQAAIAKNSEAETSYSCRHVCIEPFENDWLRQLGIELIQERVECVDRGLFASLERNDILFIDSSHVIRPQGDVLCEYFHILPALAPGVLIHIHDIFTPRDYLSQWLVNDVRFWNEQYLVEAFLSYNRDFEIIGALNLLAHRYRDRLAAKCPIYGQEAIVREPGSLWLRRSDGGSP